MRKKQIRKYLQRADDYMEKLEKKMRSMDAALFFISLGLEYFHQEGDCYEVGAVQFINDSLKSMRAVEVADLKEVLDELRKV